MSAFLPNGKHLLIKLLASSERNVVCSVVVLRMYLQLVARTSSVVAIGIALPGIAIISGRGRTYRPFDRERYGPRLRTICCPIRNWIRCLSERLSINSFLF